MRRLIAEIKRRDRVLFYTGCFNLAVLVLLMAVAPFDSRIVNGLNPAIKPMKFAISIAIYCWTIAWLLDDAGGPGWLRSLIRWGVSVAMVFEILPITLQAMRGTTSHYNSATGFDAAMFYLMGAMILGNTLLVLVLFGRYLGRVALPSPYAWGVRIGLAIFLLGSIEGLAMIFRSAHTVGLTDRSPGLWFVNWSTRAGDLRIAHAAGLHALQTLPLVGFALSRWPSGLAVSARTTLVVAFGLAYGAFGMALFAQAMRGEPLVRF
ncbi:MAG TPA: hypothetical protein VEY91_12170 [Candidatus Limnocylindria bacterium]|nr:hypothetical protein [Candidatus Limnocylindria bacterium]